LKYAEAEEEQFKKTYGTTDLAAQSMGPQEIANLIKKEQTTLSTIGANIQQIEKQWGAQTQSLKRTDMTLKKDHLSRALEQLIVAELSNYPATRVAKQRTQVNQLKADLTNDLAESMASTTSVTEYVNKIVAYESSKARIKVLENKKTAASKQPNKYINLVDTLKRIQRDVDVYDKEFQTALDNLVESRHQQQEQHLSSSIQVLDQPNFPLTANSGKRRFIILMVSLFGFVISSTVFLVKACSNNHIHSPQRAEEATGLVTAGVIPNIKKLQGLKNCQQLTSRLSDAILKNVYLADNRFGQMRILMISTRPEEGKTMISNMLCERLLDKGNKCLVVMPYIDSGSWSVVTYKARDFDYKAQSQEIAPVEKMNDADILIIELPSLVTNNYPVELIKQFNIAFLVCRANREWGNADQTALNSFVRISGIKPHIILNDVELNMVDDLLERKYKKRM
jgi:hypothetical protein